MNIYIGYDSRQDYSEDFADVVNPPYQVSKYSIEKYNKSVIIEPIIISELRRKQNTYYHNNLIIHLHLIKVLL